MKTSHLLYLFIYLFIKTVIKQLTFRTERNHLEPLMGGGRHRYQHGAL